MSKQSAQWRGSICILLLFLIGAFFIEGRELVIFTRTFFEVRNAWLPVQGLVQESLIATSERRSSGARATSATYITVYTVGARVRYTLNVKTYEVIAFGWDEYFRKLSEWEQPGVQAGRSIPIRVRPDTPDHATLLGEWTPPSSMVLGRYIATEIALLCTIVVCGKFAIRRAT